MSYGISLTPDVEADLARLPAMLASHVLDQLDRLAADPVGLSRPPAFPHPLYQKYQFFFPPEAPPEAHVTILFQFSQDETSLHIVGKGVVYYQAGRRPRPRTSFHFRFHCSSAAKISDRPETDV